MQARNKLKSCIAHVVCAQRSAVIGVRTDKDPEHLGRGGAELRGFTSTNFSLTSPRTQIHSRINIGVKLLPQFILA